MTVTILTSSPAWTAAGWTMLHLVWAGALVGLLAGVSRRILRPAAAEARYAVALVWLAVFAGSPVVIFACVFRPVVVDLEAMVLPAARSETAGVVVNSDHERTVPARARSGARTHDPAESAAWWKFEAIVPYLPAIWLTGSLSALVMLTTGLIGVHRLRQSSRIIASGEIPQRLCALALSLGIVRRVSVGVCERLAVPLLVGVVRPLILLPPAALSGWSGDQLEMVLLHELAHLRRWDNLINILQRVVESLLFFHPAVWWLTGWLRLERELCCDRLVVRRTGRPIAYAEMLVALVGSSHQGRTAALAMADRQVLTRIRRLLNFEDRSMKLTMPEGLGLLAALIVGTSLAFGLSAARADRNGESKDSIRRVLDLAARAVVALPRTATEYDFTVDTLANIAQAQMKLGDQAAALGTLQKAYEAIDRVESKKSDIEVLGSLTQVAKYQRELGDLTAARKTLDRMVKLVDSLQSRPFIQELIQVTGTNEPIRKKHEMSAAIRCELLLMIAEEQLALKDREPALATCRRALEVVEKQQGMMKPMILAYLAISLHKAGDNAKAHTVIEQALQFAKALADEREKQGAMAHIARGMAETGDLNGALELIHSLDKYGSQGAFDEIVESFTEQERGEAWLPTAGIKITIGAPSRKIKDREAAREALPRLIRAANAIEDGLSRARTLSMLAHLQAKAGDFGGAVDTALSIPPIKRKDYPGPSDGYYDALKPATMALVAQLEYAAGAKSRAQKVLQEAVKLTRAIEAADQKVIAQIVIIRKQIECSDLESARVLVREAISLAREQPEPLRARSLAVLTKSQVLCDDVMRAEETARAVREFPGLEKVSALGAIAEWYEEKGDHARAQSIYHAALMCVQSKMPANAGAQMGKPGKLRSVTATTFVDYDYELAPEFLEHQRQMDAMFLHANLGDIESAVKVGRLMTQGKHNVALGNLAGNLARKGQVAEAMKLAASLETDEQRLMAYDLVAIAIRDGQARQ